MDFILDFIFYHSLRVGIVFIVLFFIGLGLGKINPFKNYYCNILYKFFCYSLFIQWIVIALILSPYYGFADRFKKVLSNGQQLILLDETGSSSPGEGGIDFYYRLYVVDINTGKRLHRKYSGDDADLFYLSGVNLLFREKNIYSIINIKDFHILKSYQIDKLHFNYPELNPGVSVIKYNDAFLEIDSKNGRKYYLEPFTGKLWGKKPDIKTEDQSNYHVKWDSIDYFDPVTKKTSRILQFKPLQNSFLKRIELTAHHPKSPLPLDLIEPKFLDIYPHEQIVILVSYDTTDKTSFIITALDFTDERILWQLKQSDFDKSDYVKNDSTLNIFLKHDNNLIFNSGGLLIRADAKTGKIIWCEQQ
jgi:hypothetical protein